jgi:hypothetical protein
MEVLLWTSLLNAPHPPIRAVTWAQLACTTAVIRTVHIEAACAACGSYVAVPCTYSVSGHACTHPPHATGAGVQLHAKLLALDAACEPTQPPAPSHSLILVPIRAT